jgi:hypothetical protein
MRTERVDACAGGLSSRLCCLQAQGETQPAVKVQQRTSSVLARRTLVEKSGSVHSVTLGTLRSYDEFGIRGDEAAASARRASSRSTRYTDIYPGLSSCPITIIVK